MKSGLKFSQKTLIHIKRDFPLLDMRVAEMLKEAQALGESHGGIAEIVIQNPPASLGQPVFHKLKSDLAQAFLSVGATNGFELGLGFESVAVKGTEF